MSFEKETATVAAVSSQGNGFFVRDTVNILSQLEFFEGFRVWCVMPATLEWRRTA